MLLHKGEALDPKVEPGFDPELLHLLGRGGPDTVKPPDRQALDEYRAHFGRDDEESVRFAVIRRKLREKFIVRDASRRRELSFGTDPGADLLGDPCCRDDPFEVFRDVEVSLVERQWFDDRCVLSEDLPDPERDRLVG